MTWKRLLRCKTNQPTNQPINQRKQENSMASSMTFETTKVTFVNEAMSWMKSSSICCKAEKDSITEIQGIQIWRY